MYLGYFDETTLHLVLIVADNRNTIFCNLYFFNVDGTEIERYNTFY
jgi:hypothetical protein